MCFIVGMGFICNYYFDSGIHLFRSCTEFLVYLCMINFEISVSHGIKNFSTASSWLFKRMINLKVPITDGTEDILTIIFFLSVG